jgi:uncharacterized C2H2 Zn-finger protein
MDANFLKCPRCGIEVQKDRIRIINRCRACPLNEMVEDEWKSWSPEDSKKKSAEAV